MLTAAALSFSFNDARASAPPCLTTHLVINTGEYNGSPVTPGAPDPLWTISNKTAPFLGGGAPPIGYNAIVVTNPSTVGWGVNAGGGGQWLSDYQPHAVPGIATTTGSEITFRRTFSMCRQDVIQFNLDILTDNNVSDILVDGVPTGFSQPPVTVTSPVDHYSTGKDWIVTFSRSLGVGLHTLEFVVNDEYGASQNPVGLDVFGSLTSQVGALENDYMGCKYSCSPCLTGTLTVNSGMYNGSAVATGSSDPLWSISNKTPTFIGGGSPAIGAQAIVVNPVGTWGTTASGPSQWISDYQPHANPGISTTTGSELTFRRTFSLCSQDKITFDFDILDDNYVQDILVDGVSVGWNQGPFPPVVYNYATGADWYVNFSLPLGVGTHTLDIIVNDEYGATQNPVGLNIAGTLTSPLGVLENDYIGCPYRCNQSSGNGGGGQGKAGVTGASELYYMAANEQNVLYQNQPNPAYNQTSIRYEIAKIDKGAFIAVYNVAGQRIMKFDIAEPGKGSVVVDANTLKSGYYIYSLVVDGATVDTKKLIVTK